MEEEATGKLLSRQGDESVCAGIFVVPGPEGNGLTVEVDEAMVGDGHSVGVMAEVGEDLAGSTKGAFTIGYPFLASQILYEPFAGHRSL